jgi:hypothetical protein
MAKSAKRLAAEKRVRRACLWQTVLGRAGTMAAVLFMLPLWIWRGQPVWATVATVVKLWRLWGDPRAAQRYGAERGMFF